MGTTITLHAADGFEPTAYRADPAGTAKAGLVVIQEIFGVNSHIRSVTDRFAEHGYLAIAPAVFDRVERGVELGYDQEGMQRGIELARGKLDRELALADIAAAADVAREAGKVGVVGYCWGGMMAALAAIRLGDQIDAAVSYYGGGIATLIDQVPAVPLLCHFGEVDHAIPLSDVDQVRAAWPEAEVHVYAGAQHGFNCDQRASYDAASAAQAFDRTLAFFAQHLT